MLLRWLAQYCLYRRSSLLWHSHRQLFRYSSLPFSQLLRHPASFFFEKKLMLSRNFSTSRLSSPHFSLQLRSSCTRSHCYSFEAVTLSCEKKS